MAATNDQIADLDAELDALSSPTTAQTYVVSKDYDHDVVAASAARRALAGGGGGGAPAGSDGEVQYGEGAAFAASPDFVWDDETHELKLQASVNGAAVIRGNAAGVQMQILAGAGGDEIGGEVVVNSGDSTGGGGGDITIQAGSDHADGGGGGITVQAGGCTEGAAGDLNLRAGDGVTEGNVFIASGTAGYVHIEGGSGGSIDCTQTDGIFIDAYGGGKIGFFGTTPVTKETGVAVSTAAIHAALVRLGLIAA